MKNGKPYQVNFQSQQMLGVLYGRRYFTKSNTLYYKRGEPGIYGLGYCGGVKPGFWTTSVGNRAIFLKLVLWKY